MQAYSFSDLVTLADSLDLNDKAALDKWRELFHVYNKALYNPPKGIVGVGAITYAQQELANYQN